MCFDTSPKPGDDRAVILAPPPIARQFCFASAPRKVDRWPCRFTFPRAQKPDEIVTKVRRRIRCGALPFEASCRARGDESVIAVIFSVPAVLGGSKRLRPTTELIPWKSDDPSAWLFFL